MNKLRLIQVVSSKHLRIMNDSCLYFKTDIEERKQGRVQGTVEMIKKLVLNYCNYEITTEYIDSDVKDEIKAFNVDNIKQKIMIVCESKNITESTPTYTFKIFDM